METQPTSVRGPGRPRDEDLSARRSSEILEGAVRFFAEFGYADADLQVLADRVGVGKGTIYRYFPSKETLFFAAVEHGLHQLREATETAAAQAETPLQAIELAIRAYLGFFDRHPEIVELFVQERAHFRDRPQATYFIHQEAHSQGWRQLVLQLIADKVIRDIPVDRMMATISQLLYGTMFTNYFRGRTHAVEDQCQDILDLTFHGILEPGART